MKAKLTKLKGVSIVFLLSISAFAQNGNNETTQRVENENNTPSLISFSEKSNFKLTNAKSVLKEQLKMDNNQFFTKIKTYPDNQGFIHEKYQLYQNGLKVEFATYSLHSKNGKIRTMNGDFYKYKTTNRTPRLSAQAAFNKATSYIGAEKYLWEEVNNANALGYEKPKGELLLLPILEENGRKTNDVRLAYKFDIYALAPLSRGNIYIDANTGEKLLYDATIKHVGVHSHGKKDFDLNHKEHKISTAVATGNAATRYSGNRNIESKLIGSSYTLLDETRGNGIQTFNLKEGTNYSLAVNFTDNDNNWTAAEFNNSKKDNAALDAHWGAEMTYDYFKTTFNRNSFDNNGAKINSYVHYASMLDNAYWDGTRMTYGDGNSLNALTSIDVVSHEIGHAICTSTAGLVYAYESGAMNEGFSDIWAACVENFAAPEKAIWQLGEDLNSSSGIRSLSNPKSKGQPDTYKGNLWFTGAGDNGGVHYNSGVLNHWFYILSVGKTGVNDIGSSYSVNGITIKKAAEIAYRLESIYLTANSNYENARTFGIQAAKDLFGAGSAEVIATTNAFYAVGIGAAYQGSTDNIAPSAPTNLTASGTTSNSTNLSWSVSTDNVAVTGYNIYRGTTLVTTVTNTSYTITGLTAATAYTFSVKAIDAAGNLSSSSNIVSITTGNNPLDNIAPSIPNSLIANGTTNNSTNLYWLPSTDNVGVTGYNIYYGTTLITTITSTFFAVTGLSPTTTYYFSVKAKDAAGNLSASSNTVSVTTLSNTSNTSYCTSKGLNSSFEFIDLVELADMKNVSGSNGGYGDYTNLVANIPYGTSRIYISAGFSSRSYVEYWAIWIDYNKNGIFEADELIDNGSSNSSDLLYSDFTVPNTALRGKTRMRVSMKYLNEQNSCETFEYGEVEDYTVNIGTSGFVAFASENGDELGDQNNLNLFKIYPNPVNDSINLSLTYNKNSTYTIYNFLGQVVNAGSLEKNEIDVSKLEKGIYVFEINDGNKKESQKFVKK